ncbi:MAG: 3-phosphoshikimate 1-carboxyvinyltransferase [Bacillota bacterium]|nr:3-phosphoshikimate 1-carboxyvinyltransferase [Bacillota bacterium]
MEITIRPVEKIEGQTRIAGDKSISHRALLLSSLAEGNIEIEGLFESEDTISNLNCLKELGVEVAGDWGKLIVKGKGLRGFKEPGNVLDAGKSGTTARLLTGMLAGQPFHSTLTGDVSLRNRPMEKLTGALIQMGASISGRHNNELLPLTIRGYDLLPINYSLPVASAQVKSALMIAALYSRGTTEIVDYFNTNDHTERALRYLGAGIEKTGKNHTIIKGSTKLKGEKFHIPGDISTAAYFIVAAALAPHGELYLEDIGINPTRTGILEVLGKMGAEIEVLNIREYNCEPVADLHVKSGRNLRGVEINKEMIPRLIDEIPLLTAAAIFAEGDTVIYGGTELGVKESVRLKSTTIELQKMGAVIEELPDRLLIRGSTKLSGTRYESNGDHRVTMALATAALFAESESVITGIEAVQASSPGFFETMKRLSS